MHKEHKKKSIHKPTITYENDQYLVLDNFMPEKMALEMYDYCCMSNYRHINTSGYFDRAFRIRDGFPLIGDKYLIYNAKGNTEHKNEWAYPSETPLDDFVDNMNAQCNIAKNIIGTCLDDWIRYTITPYIYSKGSGLSLHRDGDNVYAGAFICFLSPTWNIHWGGILLVMNNQIDRNLEKAMENIKNINIKNGLMTLMRTNYYPRQELVISFTQNLIG